MKKKKETFFLAQVTHKKDKLVEFSWNFYYNHGELEYSVEDFATDFVMRLYLLIEIYLLYIQFIVDTSLA